jgi:hypothetical protein
VFDALAIQVFQVRIEHIARKLITDAKITEMCELQLAGNQDVGPGLVNGRGYGLVNCRVVNFCLRDGHARHQQRECQCCASAHPAGSGWLGVTLHEFFRNGHKCYLTILDG